MNNNLDVWAIQYYPNELENALNQIKGGMNIIYSNLKCFFKIGNNIISNRKFDTMLYNEESDLLIMLMRDGIANKEDIINYLEKNNKKYTEITFTPSLSEYHNSSDIPEIWFVRDEKVLNDALLDSINKDIKRCEYYPEMDGNIQLGYITNAKENCKVEGRKFKGVIKLQDKIILMIDNKYNKLSNYSILSSLSKNKIVCYFNHSNDLELENNNSKKLIKKVDFYGKR